MINHAKLLPVGFWEALKERDCHCFVFSDVDLIPRDDRMAYTCFSQPQHISVVMDKFGCSLPCQHYFGGISVVGIFFGLPTSFQIKTLRRIINYECSALAWT